MSSKSAQIQIRVTPREKAALKRLAAGAGQDVSSYMLSRALPDDPRRFEQILRRLRSEDERRFVLAELNDFLTALAPTQFAQAVGHADTDRLSLFMQNYVAARIEQAAHQKGVPPPSWVRDIPALDVPYFATPIRSLRPHLMRAAPVPFKRRNLFVDAGVGSRV